MFGALDPIVADRGSGVGTLRARDRTRNDVGG